MPTHPFTRVRIGHAARITGVYVAFALLWIWLSDRALVWLGYVDDQGFLAAVSKGTAFVAVTAVLLFWLVRREVAAVLGSERLLRAVIEGTTDAVYVKGFDGRYLLVNAAAARFIGRPVAEVLGRDDRELFDAMSAERLAVSNRAVMVGGEVVTTEETLTTAGGSRIFHATKAPLRDASGRVIGLVGISRDVTDIRRAAERALRDAAFHEAVIRTAGDGICACHAVPEFPFVRMTLWNARMTDLTGYTFEEINRLGWYQSMYPDPVVRERAKARMEAMRDKDNLQGEEWEITRKDGERRVVAISTSCVDHVPGETTVVAFFRDVTDRRRADDALWASEQRFRELGDAIPQIVWAAGPDGGLTFLNAKVAEYSGVSADALKGWSWGAIIHPDDLPHTVTIWKEILTSGVPQDVEFRIRRADGAYRWHVTRESPARDATGAVTGWYGTCTDIEDRKRAEDELRRTVSLLQATLDATADGILVVDLEGRIVDLNRQFVALWHMPPEVTAIGRKEDLVAAFRDEGAMAAVFGQLADPAGFAARVAEIYRTPDQPSYDVVGFRDGTILERYSYPQRIDGTPVGRVWSFRDVTDRRRAEAALARRQGVLERIAGGAAAAEVLADIVDLIECEIESSVCSILLLDADRRLRIGAAQHLPPEYNAAIDGIAAGPAVGSCGTAAHFGRPVIVADIATDPLWADYRAAALPHDLRACWSVPIIAAEATGSGPVLGTFAVYRRRVSAPTPDELGILHASAHLAGIAIERERAGRVLRESEERFRALVEFGYEGINVLTAAGWSVYSSPNNASLVALAPGEVDDDALGFVHPDDRARARGTLADVSASPGRQADVTIRLVRKDGTTFWAEAHARNLCDHPAVRGVVVNWRDVSDRVAAEAKLRESEERYRLLVDTLPTSVHVISGGRVTFCNPACVTLFGASSESELLGKTPYELLHPDSHGPVSVRITTSEQGIQRAPLAVVKIVRVDGQVRTVHAVATPIPNGKHPDTHLVCLNDVTEQERATALLRTVLGSVNDAIITIDERGVVRSVNPAAVRQFGYTEDELVGCALEVLIAEPHREGGVPPGAHSLRLGASQGTGIGREVDCRRRDGTRFPGELTVTEFTLEGERHFTGVLRDTTERRQLEEQLRQSQKMEAIGRLAGGVAHDFNNLLTVINGHSELLMTSERPAGRWRESVPAIREAGERAARLTQQLLAFSRKSLLEPKVLDLNELVTESAKLLRRLIGEDINLVVLTAPTPVRVKADPSQLEQVIMNLVVNARDAMPTGGRLTLETATVAPPSADPVRFARLSVSDTGQGMTDEVKEKVFEPFFTTKGVGKGTGLGLAVVHGVITQSGGQITVESAVGVGTTFRLLLPLVEAEAAGAPSDTRLVATRGAETVLLVEDEEAVRMIARLALEMQGYTVLEADGGAAALRWAETHPGEIHLLVSDVVMPEMGGRQLLEAVRRHRPGVRVLFMSGYTDDAVLRHGVVGATDAFIQKPFTPLGLARKVREVIDAPAR